MPRKRIQRITAWSFSRFDTYQKCPLLAKFKFIDKRKEPEPPPEPEKGSFLARGKRIHKEAELYATGQLRKMPESLELFEDEFKMLRKIKRKLKVEQQLAVGKDWEPCGWLDAETWLRAGIDLSYIKDDVLVIVDYKTGRSGNGSTDQLELYAIVGLQHAPEHVMGARCEFWYLDQGEIFPEDYDASEPRIYTRAEAEKLKKAWEKKTKKMLTDTTFKATPSDKTCRWCYFGQSGKAEGGPGLCQY